MEKYRLYDGEYKFMQVVWQHEPIGSTQLSKLCLEVLGWKKSTVYTVLRKLCDRGVVQNENSVVSALVRQEDVQQYESNTVMEKNFNGSLPAFVATFLKDKKLSEQEAEELKHMIEKAVKK